MPTDIRLMEIDEYLNNGWKYYVRVCRWHTRVYVDELLFLFLFFVQGRFFLLGKRSFFIGAVVQVIWARRKPLLCVYA